MEIGPNECGQRLDKYLAKVLAEAPKSFIYKMLRKKNITLNGKKASGSEKLQSGDHVKFFLSDDTMEKFSRPSFVKTAHNLDIVFENPQVLLMNKPPGLLSQKGAPGDVSLVEEMISYLLDSNALKEEDLAVFRPGICNRLDRNTSGLVAAGKTLAALQQLSEMFRERLIHKYYLCVVKGTMQGRRTIKGYLYKNERQNKVAVSEKPIEGGQPIETAYEPMDSNGTVTLCRVLLVTGRTHQIRSHLASIGFPIAGDGKYGDEKFNRIFRQKYQISRQLLHAWEIVFPRMEPDLLQVSGRSFQAELPDDFNRVLEGESLQCISDRGEYINGGKKYK